MGFSANYCAGVPDIYYGGGEVCAEVQQQPVELRERECWFGTTPEMYSVDARLLSENLGPVNFSFGFWIGVEMVNEYEWCLWIGNEDYQICQKKCTTPQELQQAEVVADLVADFNQALKEETGYSILELIGTIIVIIIVAIAMAFISIVGPSPTA